MPSSWASKNRKSKLNERYHQATDRLSLFRWISLGLPKIRHNEEGIRRRTFLILLTVSASWARPRISKTQKNEKLWYLGQHPPGASAVTLHGAAHLWAQLEGDPGQVLHLGSGMRTQKIMWTDWNSFYWTFKAHRALTDLRLEMRVQGWWQFNVRPGMQRDPSNDWRRMLFHEEASKGSQSYCKGDIGPESGDVWVGRPSANIKVLSVRWVRR